MYPRKFYGTTLAEILLSVGIAAFIAHAILVLLTVVLLHERTYADVFDELRTKSRIFSIIESRIASAGLGVPLSENVEDIFRFPLSGKSALPGWRNVLEILTNNDVPAHFQDADGEQVARGERMRVLSTSAPASDVRLIPSGAEWGPREVRTVNISKGRNKFDYAIKNGELSSWITMPSLGRPVIIISINAPNASNTGSAALQNPLPVSMDWHGAEMFHAFRISYFHAEVETLYIRDAASAYLNKEPVADGVLSACFEFNKTAETLRCWFLVRSSAPSGNTGIPREWPAWAKVPPPAYSNKVKVITHAWRLKNI